MKQGIFFPDCFSLRVIITLSKGTNDKIIITRLIAHVFWFKKITEVLRKEKTKPLWNRPERLWGGKKNEIHFPYLITTSVPYSRLNIQGIVLTNNSQGTSLTNKKRYSKKCILFTHPTQKLSNFYSTNLLNYMTSATFPPRRWSAAPSIPGITA